MERRRDSSERLEDNAIIRNYRVRPRFAELSHSVSITGAVIPAYTLPIPDTRAHVNSCIGYTRRRKVAKRRSVEGTKEIHCGRNVSRRNVNIISGKG